MPPQFSGFALQPKQHGSRGLPPTPEMLQAQALQIAEQAKEDPMAAFLQLSGIQAPSKPLSGSAAPPATSDVDPLDAFMKSLSDAEAEFRSKPPAPTVKKAAPAQPEVDPLDAFMASLKADEPGKKSRVSSGHDDLDDEETVAQETFERFAAAAEGGQSHQSKKENFAMPTGEAFSSGMDNYDSDEEVYAAARAADGEVDEDGNPIKSKGVEHLPPVNHFDIKYIDFKKDFYHPHPSLLNLPPIHIEELNRGLEIETQGTRIPAPATKFELMGLDAVLLKRLKKREYEAPTNIQALAIPVALSGRDVIGIAKTGSGKTVAFVLPMITHLMAQPELKKGEGPIGVVVAPTRELADQIHIQAKGFGKGYNLVVAAVYGGMNKHEQFRTLKGGCEIAVCTPGRIIDLIRMKACNMTRCTFVVLDEADRMFQMGFEFQVRSILNQIRPDRQVLLFSATFHKRVEAMVRDVCQDPVRIVVGTRGAASANVHQVAEVLGSDNEKWSWLTQHLTEFLNQGTVLVFVGQRAASELLAKNLSLQGFKARALHGEMAQHDRMMLIADFKATKFDVLVATDVAARGLDIKGLETVVNYDVARTIDSHTHRVGRVGRAGNEGYAYTLITQAEEKFAGLLVDNLEDANQPVPSALMTLAMKNEVFRKLRQYAQKASRGGRESGGFGGGMMGGGKRKPVNTIMNAVAPPTAYPTQYHKSIEADDPNAPPSRPQTTGRPVGLEDALRKAQEAAARLTAGIEAKESRSSGAPPTAPAKSRWSNSAPSLSSPAPTPTPTSRWSSNAPSAVPERPSRWSQPSPTQQADEDFNPHNRPAAFQYTQSAATTEATSYQKAGHYGGGQEANVHQSTGRPKGPGMAIGNMPNNNKKQKTHAKATSNHLNNVRQKFTSSFVKSSSSLGGT